MSKREPIAPALDEMIANSPVAAVLCSPRLPDNPIVACNDAFTALTGYDRAEIVGRNCRFLAGPDTESGMSQAIRDGVAERRPVMVEVLNYKKDGTRFRNAVLVAPIFDANGELEYFLGSQVEVADPAKGLDARKANAAARVAALTPRQKEVLSGMAAGKLNKQIAYDLGLTERTIKMHRAALIQALEVKTGADALRLAIEAGY